MKDEFYMDRAIQLGNKGCGWISPNPMVGAVIVKNGRIIGEGYHEKYGEAHAERNALAACRESPKGAVMYVTLEPCCHYGKQPPCTEALAAAGIKQVIIGTRDPNPLVAGKGITYLKQKGILVKEGVLEEECKKMNQVFFHFIQTRRPFVVMKYAMSMDGKIACYTGDSQWITGEKAREQVHKDRHRYSAIMAGAGTVLADDPLLTCRMKNGKNPIRVICDTHLRIPPSCRVVQTAFEAPVILATCCGDKARQEPYERAGCRILTVPEKNGHTDLSVLMKRLGEEGIDSLLLEGGGTLNWSALKNGIVNKVQAYIGPLLIGGEGAKTPVSGEGYSCLKEAVRLKNTEIIKLGEDFLIESEVCRNVYGDH